MTTQRWEIDSSHSSIQFLVRHLVISKVRGQFSRWSGSLTTEGDAFTNARASVVIDASSLDTGVADRDAHLKSADFFDVERYPEVRFEAERTAKRESGQFALAGMLTLHGVTREVALEVELTGRTTDPWGNERVGFSARATIDRKEFGLTWNQVLETGGVMVGDKVEIEIDLEAVRQVATKVA